MDINAVTAAVEAYVDAFNAQDFERCLRYYRLPTTWISSRGVIVIETREAFIAAMARSTRDLRARGLHRTEHLLRSTRILADNVALTSATAVRYRADGSELERTGGTMALSKDEQGWRIVTVLIHHADGAVRLEALSGRD
jgi:ketosteroid isomerase-like protein